MHEHAEQPSIVRNAGFQLAAQLASGVFSAVLVLFLTRELGPEGFGLFALALGIGALLMLPSDFGISAAAARFVAERSVDERTVAEIARQALGLKLIATGGVSVALFVSAGWIADVFAEDGLVWPLRGIAIAIFGQSLFLFFTGLFLAQQRASANLRLTSGESAVELAASVALVLLGAGAAGAAFGRGIGYLAGSLLGAALLAQFLGRRSVRPAAGAWARPVARYAAPLALTNWVTTTLAYLDTVLVAAFLSSAAVALVQAPLRLVPFLLYPALAIASTVAPALARPEGGARPDMQPLLTALRVLVILHAAMVAVILVWAGPIVELLFGPGYAGSAEILRALSPYVFLAGLAPLLSFSANYLGLAGGRLPIALGALVVNVAVDLALIPLIGAVGAAVGLSLAFCLYVPAHLRLCRQELGFSLRPLLETLARASLAAGAASLVLLAAGTSELGAGRWVAGSLGGLAVFCAVLLATREIVLSDLQLAYGALRRRTAGSMP
jgi:O-antigen/teichoic acid export membrane protein